MATNLKERKPLHRAKLHVHKGDTVLVLSGKDRGKQATVERTMPRENRVVVEGINIAKKRVRAGRGVLQAGIIEKNAPLHWSNVMLVCTKCDKPTRVRTDWSPDGKKVRFCKKCGEIIDKV